MLRGASHLAIIAAMACLGALPGCTSPRAPSPHDGDVIGRTYSNAFFRLQLDLPPGWVVFPPSLRSQTERELRLWFGKSISILLAAGRKDERGPAFAQVIGLATERLRNQSLTLDEVLPTLEQGLSCGGSFDRRSVRLGDIVGMVFSQACRDDRYSVAVAVSRGYAVVILGSWHADDQRPTIDHMIDSARFALLPEPSLPPQ